MSKSLVSLGIFLFHVYFAHADVHFALKEGYEVDYEAEDVMAERSAVSRRHCSQLCMASNCTAANYNPATSQCQLLSAAVTRLLQKSGSTALFRKDVTVEGQVGMWPLNELYIGKNLVPGKTDIQLYDVAFPDMSSDWMSLPVRFSGASSSYGQFINVDDVKVSDSFAFITAVYREQTGDCALLEFDSESAFKMHIWIYENKFLINMLCGTMVYSSTVSNNQWYTMALSYNHVTNVLSMWVDGQLEEKTNACSSSPVTSTAVYAFVNHRLADNRKIIGRITCMGLYDRSMTYEDMYTSTTPHCLLN